MVTSEMYHIGTWQHANFHQPSMNLTKYQKGASNVLPSYNRI